MKIDSRIFLDEFFSQVRSKSIYQANIDHNWGRYNYYQIYKCAVNGRMYYYASPCKTTNTNLAAVKRVCARN